MTTAESYLIAAAELEQAGQFREANRLRVAAQQCRTESPELTARRNELKQRIAELESDGRYGSAQKLKTQLATLK